MSFDQAAVTSLVSQLESMALKLGVFRSVNFHEPKSAPGSGLRLAIWADSIEPVGAGSGLSATSGYVVCMARVYGSMLTKPEDEIDPSIITSMTTLMNALSGGFTLGSTVRDLDLLGMYGQKLAARAGYLVIGSTMYRVMTLTIPVIINDLWTQVP